MFEALHGHADGAALARHRPDATGRLHGVAIREYLARLAADRDEIAAAVAEGRRRWVREHYPAGADDQVERVADRLGLIAAAGELATALGILPWPDGEASRAAAACYGAWITARGGTGPAELAAGIEQVRLYIVQHGASRFERRDGETARDRAGWGRDGEGGEAAEYLILPDVRRAELPAAVGGRGAAVEAQDVHHPRRRVGLESDAVGTDPAPLAGVALLPDVASEGVLSQRIEGRPQPLSVACGNPGERLERRLCDEDASHRPWLRPRCGSRRGRTQRGLPPRRESPPRLSVHRRAEPSAARRPPGCAPMRDEPCGCVPSGAPSRVSSATASSRLARASSSVSPCVLAPGNSSTYAMEPPSSAGSNTAVNVIAGERSNGPGDTATRKVMALASPRGTAHACPLRAVQTIPEIQGNRGNAGTGVAERL